MARVLRFVGAALLPLMIGCQSRPDGSGESPQSTVSSAKTDQATSSPAATNVDAKCQVYREGLAHAIADVAGSMTGVELTCRTLDPARCNEYIDIHQAGVSTVKDMVRVFSTDCPSLKDELAKTVSELESLMQRLERVTGRSPSAAVPVRSRPAVLEAASPTENEFEIVNVDPGYRMVVRDDVVTLSRNAETVTIHRLQDVKTSRGMSKPFLDRVAYADLGPDIYFVLSFSTITYASFFRGLRVRKGDLSVVWDEGSPFGVGSKKLIDGSMVYNLDASLTAVDLETGKTKWPKGWYDPDQLPSLGNDTRMSVDADGNIVLSDFALRVVVDRESGAVRSTERSR
jgi:hypothetical protein